MEGSLITGTTVMPDFTTLFSATVSFRAAYLGPTFVIYMYDVVVLNIYPGI